MARRVEKGLEGLLARCWDAMMAWASFHRGPSLDTLWGVRCGLVVSPRRGDLMESLSRAEGMMAWALDTLWARCGLVVSPRRGEVWGV